MSFDEAKRERIKTYLIEKIDADDKCVVSKVADAFGISLTSVKRYIDTMISSNIIMRNEEKASGYSLVREEQAFELPFVKGKTVEDRFYFGKIAPLIEGLPETARKKWYYCASEMLNNCIDHSGGTLIKVVVSRNYLYTEISILDDGVGAIKNIWERLRMEDPEATYDDAYMELIKGRFTTDSSAHSGEGIFFTSRLCDEFTLISNGCYYHRNVSDQTFIRHRLLAYATAYKGMGTYVLMRIANASTLTSKEVFDAYSTVDAGIFKTEIPLAQFCEFGDPVARSHAKRVCNRLDSFSEVVVDFDGIEFMGQGFADEMFRVYLNAHPEVRFTVINANADILKMLGHVGFKAGQ